MMIKQVHIMKMSCQKTRHQKQSQKELSKVLSKNKGLKPHDSFEV